jgi:histidinol-phosphate aminotransferase
MMAKNRLSRRAFLGTSTASALSVVFLPGVGRVKASPYPREIQDYEGRLCYNENPLGPSPLALTALQEAATLAHRYPDWFSSSLEARIATEHGLAANNICAGGGATEVIRLVADALLGPGDEIVTATPTYSQMGNDAVANGATVVHVPLDGNYRIDLTAIQAAIGPKTRMVSLVNPNNPVATIFDKNAMENFIATLPDGVVVVVDEAYHEYVPSPDYESCVRYVHEGASVIVIRTLSKAYGLAGARIGYAVASVGHADLIGSSQLFGTISRPSQAAAIAALDDTAHVTATVDLNNQARTLLETGFTNLGLAYIPSETNFMMFDTGTSADGIRSQLASAGYLVRTGWGMPQHIRVSTGLLPEVQGFLDALAAILATDAPGIPSVPVVLAVTAVHPNPFNGRCRIRITVPGGDPVVLTVHDVAGRKVRSLVRRSLTPGVHSIPWDGRDHSGRQVASGAYLLNLVQGEYATTGRVTYVK